MKWPESLTLVRHDVSIFNELKPKKSNDPLYQEFRDEYDSNPNSDRTKELAKQVYEKYSLQIGDHETPLGETAGNQAQVMASNLKDSIPTPNVIFVSPYHRTKETLKRMTLGWPELSDIKTVEEERLREQDHGLALVYSDNKVFNAMHQDQRLLHEIEGNYWYRFPNGENIPDVRERLRSWIGTITRDYREQNILAVTHHIAILSLRANLERLGADEFHQLDRDEKPINAGVTIYRGNPNEGEDGHLELEIYNSQLY